MATSTKTKKDTAKAENVVSKEGNGFDQESIFAEMQEVFANMSIEAFETVEIPFTDIQVNKPGINRKTKKMVQNIEFEFDGETRVYAMENLGFIRNLIDGYKEYKTGNEDAVVTLPISAKVSKKMDLKEGTHWIYN